MSEQDKDTCCYKSCKDRVEIYYYGKPLCDKHWNKLSEKTPTDVKKELGIKKENDQ